MPYANPNPNLDEIRACHQQAGRIAIPVSPADQARHRDELLAVLRDSA